MFYCKFSKLTNRTQPLFPREEKIGIKSRDGSSLDSYSKYSYSNAIYAYSKYSQV